MRAKAASLMTFNYSDRFRNHAAVESYESGEYGQGSYSSFIWELEQPVLKQLVSDFARRQGSIRLLDFACGTGRILSSIEELADSAEGVDISEAMVQLAKNKCRKAEFKVGDILSNPTILRGPYDVITCFRFILNVEPQIRSAALVQLRKVLKPGGILIASVHGNSASLRHPAIAWRRRQLRKQPAEQQAKWMLNEMPLLEARELFQNCGFEIIQYLGFGIMPPTLHRTPLRKMAMGIDRLFAGKQWLKNNSIDLLFVCRPSV